jgi:hypothetical protein
MTCRYTERFRNRPLMSCWSKMGNCGNNLLEAVSPSLLQSIATIHLRRPTTHSHLSLAKKRWSIHSRLRGDLRAIRCESAVAMRVYGLFSNNAFPSHFEKFTSTRKNQSPAFLQRPDKTVTRGNLASGIYVIASLAAKLVDGESWPLTPYGLTKSLERNI